MQELITSCQNGQLEGHEDFASRTHHRNLGVFILFEVVFTLSQTGKTTATRRTAVRETGVSRQQIYVSKILSSGKNKRFKHKLSSSAGNMKQTWRNVDSLLRHNPDEVRNITL